jgi:hypothetical protein
MYTMIVTKEFFSKQKNKKGCCFKNEKKVYYQACTHNDSVGLAFIRDHHCIQDRRWSCIHARHVQWGRQLLQKQQGNHEKG